MLFQTHLFLLVFLPVTLVTYFLAARRTELRIAVLIIASLIFYGWWDARFIPLLLGQATLTWIFAEIFFRFRRKSILWLGIAINLAVLCLFKYADFLISNVEAIIGYKLPHSSWVLPIGISFFTFELVSYLADQMRGHQKHYRFSRFMLFVLFFPRLIAGPIVRHDEIVEQFEADPLREGASERFARGFVLLILGLAKKILIADPLAAIADPMFAASAITPQPLIDSWMGALAFSLQLYFDFSAYTDMAIGMAMMMGLKLPINFNVPYRAASLREFWRRWHMTLSRYIRDYLYIPLGGSKAGEARFVFATMVSMTLCGLWHGAGWNFVAWGAMHGFGLLVCRMWQRTGVPLPYAIGWLLTMAFVGAGWVLFRSPDFATSISVFSGLSGQAGIGAISKSIWIIAVAAIVAVIGPTSLTFVERYLLPWRSGAILWVGLWLYCLLVIGGENPVSFIYFQF